MICSAWLVPQQFLMVTVATMDRCLSVSVSVPFDSNLIRVTLLGLPKSHCETAHVPPYALARSHPSRPPRAPPPTQRGRIAIAFTNDFVPATNRLNTHATSISYHANESMTSGMCVCVCVAPVHGIKGGMIAFIINLNLSTTWKLFDLKFSCS